WAYLAPRPAGGPPLYAEDEIRKSASERRSQFFKALYKSMEPDGWLQDSVEQPPDRRGPGEYWTQAQGLAAMLATPEASDAQLVALWKSMQLPFEPGCVINARGIAYGWPIDRGRDYPMAEPTVWTSIYLAIALHRPGFLNGEKRQQCEQWLQETQK